ncbi:amine oxidase [Photobacterium leiognathi subsp. mandapamensis]|nr:amine oxidase [Photobacterium leiognathi subsp. mandapamensis]
MTHKKVAILGGGLSGLYAAYLLEQQGIQDYILLEARDILGGRIMGFQPNDEPYSFDLGPTWFWPDIQPQFAQVIADLGLTVFAQNDDGNMLVEQSLEQAPRELAGFVTSPTSMRLTGGMDSIIKALAAKLRNPDIYLSTRVTQIEHKRDLITVHCQESHADTEHSVNVDHVLLAIPPRLVSHNIVFSPSLPKELITQWQNTATWMAPHAKYIAVYERPFWREQGLSGSARSMVGPMVEIHDASEANHSANQDNNAALFGFIGIPVAQRKMIGEAQLKAYCQQQLIRLFGEQAATPIAHIIQDWAQETFTATSFDAQEMTHSLPPANAPFQGAWARNITGIASEWAPEFPGFLAGAIEAANIGVTRYIALHKENAKA